MEVTGKKLTEIDGANVILIGFDKISSCNYIFLVKKVVHDLADYLAKLILRWRLPLTRTRIIGHSLGE